MVRFVKHNLPVVGVLTIATTSHAFSAQQHASTRATIVSPLHAFVGRVKYDEEDAAYLMEKARECAFSDTCSLEEATHFLNEVVHVQGSCAAGTLSGSSLCEDVLPVNDVVTGLRARIEKANEQSTNMAKASAEAGSFPLVPLYVGVAALCFLVTIMNNDATIMATPFTAQEWFWAARDGYLPDVVRALVRDGGFVVDPDATTMSSAVLPFTAQEWWWSMRDGYFGNMVSVAMREGGLSADCTSDVVLPFTGEEWWWAARDGYLGNMMSQAFRNGGV